MDAQQWHIDRIGVPKAQEISSGNPGVTVAILDTGIDHSNQDLTARIVTEIDFTSSGTSSDSNGHGTHIAGTTAGVAPECSLMNVKVADNAGECQISVLAQGIKWAVDNGAKVINASLGAESLSDLQQSDLQEAVDYAWNKGAIVVAAAGNENTSTPSYPACCANCIAVAATDDTDSLASFSNHGDWVDVAAPGEHIYSTWLHNQHEVQDGTSSAAALVSGVVALVFGVIIDSNADGLVNDKVRWVIENSCSPITSIGSGKGRIDAFAAVRAAKQSIQTTTYALPSTESSTIH